MHGSDGANKRAVAKLDYINLDVITTYESVDMASQKEGVNYTRIIDSCAGRKLLIKGYLWRYIGEDGKIIHPPIGSKKCKIGKFDLRMGLVKIFSDLDSTNLNPANIHKVCTGKCKTIDGHIWRHLDLFNNIVKPEIKYKHKTISKMDMQGVLLDIYENANKASEAIENGSPDLIIRCCKNIAKSHRGFLWKYNDY